MRNVEIIAFRLTALDENENKPKREQVFLDERNKE
jgi:hypothetical protein